MAYDKIATPTGDAITINENGVMIYRLSGTNQLVKAELK